MSTIDSGAKPHAGQAQFDHSAARRLHDDAVGKAWQADGKDDPQAAHIWGIVWHVVGVLARWLTFLAVIWSYRVWEPLVVRGMGRRYYATRHVFIALFVFSLFPLFWLFLAPGIAAVIGVVPGLNLATKPFAHVAPDLGAFMGQKDAVAQVQAAYDTPIGSQVPVVATQRKAPPSFTRVYSLNLLSDPWMLNYAKTLQSQGWRPTPNQEAAHLARKGIIFAKSFLETIFYFIPIDAAIFLALVGIYLVSVVRHFRDARLVEDSRFEGVMLWQASPESASVGFWKVPLLLCTSSIVVALCGLSLIATFLLCSGISLGFFRGRLAAKAAGIASDKLDQPAASARQQAEKDALEAIRRATVAAARKEALEEEGRAETMTDEGIEVARDVAPVMVDSEAKEFVRSALEKLQASDDPSARRAARKILAAI